MLTLLEINPTGYFSFGLHDTIQLDGHGVVLLEGLNLDRGGSANGAGKSSLFNTITTILFDKNPTEYSGNAIVNEFLGKSFGKITFLDKAGVKWRIISTRGWRKSDKYPCATVESEPSEWHNHKERYSGTDIYLERWDGSIWKDERGTNRAGDTRLDIKATRRKISDVLGITYQQFMNVAYLAQQQSLKFVRGTHKERMEVITELSDIGVWTKRQEKVKDRIKVLESEIDRLNSLLDGVSRTGSLLQEPNIAELNKLASDKADLESLLALKTSRLTELYKAKKQQEDAAARDIEESVRVKQKLRDLSVQRSAFESDINNAVRDYANACSKIRSLPRDNAILNLENEVSITRGKIQARRWDLEQLLQGSGRCPRCRSMVTDNHILSEREVLLRDIADMEETVKISLEKISVYSQAHDEQILQALDREEKNLSARKSEIETLIAMVDVAIDAANTELHNIPVGNGSGLYSIINQIKDCEREQMNANLSISSIDERIKDFNKRQAQWESYKVIIKDSKDKIALAEDELKYLKVIDKAFGDKGIKAHKLGMVLAALNKSVQEFANVLTDGAVKIYITPFREKADGSLSTDMQIMVQELEKKDTPFDLYSGGEKQQIVLAFIGAFWHVAALNGSGVNILCLDEIFGPLDELNAHGVFRYLDHMKQQGKSTIMVVTHDKNIKNHLNFDQKWLVQKSNHQSKLTMDV